MKLLIYLILLLTFVNATVLNEVESYDEALETAKKQNKKVLMFMYSAHCPWCEKMKKNTFTNQKIINYINNKYIFVKMEMDMDEYPITLKPRYIPTTYVIDPLTKETEEIIYGYKSSEDFIGQFWSDE